MKLRVELSAAKLLDLCVEYNERKGTMQISCAPLIDVSLQKFGLEDVNSVSIPVEAG